MIILLVELHLFFTSEKCPESQIKQKYMFTIFLEVKIPSSVLQDQFLDSPTERFISSRTDIFFIDMTTITFNSVFCVCESKYFKNFKNPIKLFQAVCYKEGIFHACVLIYHYDKRVIKPGSPFI